MSVIETIGVFVGIPAAAVLVLFLAVYGRSTLRQPNRYRPGKPWPYAAAWYAPHPDALLHKQSGGLSTTAVGGAVGEW